MNVVREEIIAVFSPCRTLFPHEVAYVCVSVYVALLDDWTLRTLAVRCARGVWNDELSNKLWWNRLTL